MFELTQEQRQELSVPEPVAIDPQTREKYVLVRKDVYDKLKGIIDYDAVGTYSLLATLDPEDWEDVSVYENTPCK